MFANVFLILCAYYFIKPLREGWIAVSDIPALTKMEVKAYSSFGQSILLIFAVSAYAKLADKYQRAKLINGTTLFCMSNLVVFWMLQPGFFVDHLPGTGILFYLWVGMFGVFIVAQFWAFAANLYQDEQGQRLIPMVAIGATAGAASGSWITDALVGSGVVGAKFLLLAALAPLAASVVLTTWCDRRGATGTDAGARTEEDGDHESQSAASPTQSDPTTDDRRSAMQVIFRSRYLIAVAAITLLMNWVNTNGENLLFGVVQDSLTGDAAEQGIVGEEAVRAFTRDGTAAFYGNFFFWVNIIALLLQAFAASRLLRYGGFGLILLLLPSVALVSYSVMAVFPVLAIVKAMKVLENSTDYSINNTARHVLWLPVGAADTYKGKPAVDSLFARFGDGLAALTVLVGVQVLGLSTAGFFAFTVVLVLLWLGGAGVVIAEHRKLGPAPTSH